MEISLREWLIIGGILVIVLILFDGWRRINSNRNRLRIDIDPSFSDSDASESVSHFNPELPNGGARPLRNASDVDPESEQEVAEAPAADGFRHTRLGAMVQPQALRQKMEPLGATLKAASSSMLAKAQEKPVEQDRIEPGFASVEQSTNESPDDHEVLPGLEPDLRDLPEASVELEAYETDLSLDDETIQDEAIQDEVIQHTAIQDEYQETADEPKERWIYSTDEIPEPALEITVEPEAPLEHRDAPVAELDAEDDSDAFFSTELDYDEPVASLDEELLDEELLDELPEEQRQEEQPEILAESLDGEEVSLDQIDDLYALPLETASDELSAEEPYAEELPEEELPEELPEEELSEEELSDLETINSLNIPEVPEVPEEVSEEIDEEWQQDLSTPVTHVQDTRALHEMDPLFDDIPLLPRTAARQSEPQPQQPAQQPAKASAQVTPAAAKETRQSQRPPQQLEVAALAPVDAEPAKGQNLDLDFDLDQPITMLLDRSRNKRATISSAESATSSQESSPLAAEPRRSTRPERKKSQAPSAGAIRDLWADPEPSITLPDLESEPVEAEPGFSAPVDTPNTQPVEEAPFFAQEPAPAAESEPVLPPAPVADPPVQESKPAKKVLSDLPEPEHVLVITVVGNNKEPFTGSILRRVVEACGMEHGDMSIFHRFEGDDDNSPVQFSMANAVNPGTFDLEHIEEMETPAVSFFMSMLEPRDPMTAYECMLATAETLAKHVGGDLLDEDRSVMRPQTKEHYRQRIRDFEMENRRQQRVL